MGRFLRQYRDGKTQVDQVLADCGVKRRADGAVSGATLGSVNFTALSELRVSALGFPLGKIADTLTISEELGSLAYLCMWLNSPIAQAAYRRVRRFSTLTLSGDYRWSSPSRLTTGVASIEPGPVRIGWQHMRCLKAVAEDLIRPPHALEFVLDYRIGPPGLKFFRCVCAIREGAKWQVLPALADTRPLAVLGSLPDCVATVQGAELAALLIYCEPWSRTWMIADALEIQPDDAFAHALSWADFQRELSELSFDNAVIEGVGQRFRELGMHVVRAEDANLTRSLLPFARALIRELRRLE